MKLSAQNKFNKQGNIIIISNYPTFDEKGVMGNINGVSKYTYHLLPQLKLDMQSEDRKIIVLADIPKDSKEECLEEDGILFVRCWRKDDLKVYKKLLNTLKYFKNVNKVLIHFEFNMFGNMFATLAFASFLKSLRRHRKNITLLLHQIVEDLDELNGHLNVKPHSLKIGVLNYGIRRFYWMLLGIANKIIVHDSIFMERLSRVRRKNPVFIIPHGMIDNSEYCEVVDPREKLGIKRTDFIILAFGFLTWYKGSDWIAKQFVKYYKRTGDESIKLILAGGRSANLKDRHFYQKYYFDLLNTIEGCPNIIHTGFVADEDIKDYYCAADVSVFPYRTHMSTSGPFSYALSFDRPFLISREMSSILDTPDIKEIMMGLGVEKSDLTFSLNRPGDLFDKISKLIESKKRRNLMSLLSERIKTEREWGRTAKKFLFVIDA